MLQLLKLLELFLAAKLENKGLPLRFGVDVRERQRELLGHDFGLHFPPGLPHLLFLLLPQLTHRRNVSLRDLVVTLHVLKRSLPIVLLGRYLTDLHLLDLFVHVLLLLERLICAKFRLSLLYLILLGI